MISAFAYCEPHRQADRTARCPRRRRYERKTLPRLARFDRRRDDTEDLEHHGGADQRGRAARIEGWRDLDDVAADEVEAGKAAHHDLRLENAHAAAFRRAGTGRVDRVEPVDVEADIGRAVADDAPRLLDDCFGALLVELLH